MERVLAAGLLAMVISILVGPKFINFLRRNEFGQMIREEGPAGHAVKQGTPTGGGLMIVVGATWLIMYNAPLLLRALGWAPRHSFEEALADTVEWYRDNRAWWEPLQGRAPVVEDTAWQTTSG